MNARSRSGQRVIGSPDGSGASLPRAERVQSAERTEDRHNARFAEHMPRKRGCDETLLLLGEQVCADKKKDDAGGLKARGHHRLTLIATKDASLVPYSNEPLLAHRRQLSHQFTKERLVLGCVATEELGGVFPGHGALLDPGRSRMCANVTDTLAVVALWHRAHWLEPAACCAGLL